MLVKEGYYKIRGGGEAAEEGWRGRRRERQREVEIINKLELRTVYVYKIEFVVDKYKTRSKK